MNPLRSVLLAASQSPRLRRQATRHRFVRRAVSRFMPGETLDAAIQAAGALRAGGVATILTHLGENVSDPAEAEAVVAHYHEVLEGIRRTALDAEVSVKLTQVGLDLDRDLACDHLARIAGRARDVGNRVWIDMEATPYADRTLEVFRRLRATYTNVGLCLQTYLRRTEADLESLLPLGASIRLVKGAYREPRELVFARKADVDESFFRLSVRLLGEEARRAGARLVVGTHDTRLIGRIADHVATRGLAKDACEYALLYGIQRREQARLAREGFRVRVLISYGTHWFPWYMRRLAERPANLLFMGRSLLSR